MHHAKVVKNPVSREILALFKRKTRKTDSLLKSFRIFANRLISNSTMSYQAITQQIVDYFKTQPVVKAWIFGSYARGEQTENSDIDILIQPEQSVGLFKLSGMHLDLQDMLHIDVDLVTVKGLLPFARKSADRDKILIYERTS
jgi:predicted nucleotidyltransferase